MLSVLERNTVGGPPDGRRSIAQYRTVAAHYDQRTAFGEPYRREAVQRLAPAAGEVVLDIGCGTGLNFAGLLERVGAEGWLVGIDHSPEMLERAQARVREQGWGNVTLLEAPAEDAAPAMHADAALLCATHDILRSLPALKNVLRHVKDGGRIVAAGPKWAPWWRPDAASVDLCTWQVNQAYVTTFEGFGKPCSHLAELVPGLVVEDTCFGAGYLATGTR